MLSWLHCLTHYCRVYPVVARFVVIDHTFMMASMDILTKEEKEQLVSVI